MQLPPDPLANLTQTAPPDSEPGQDGPIRQKMLVIIRTDRKGMFKNCTSEEPEAVALQLIHDGKARLFNPLNATTPTSPPNASPEPVLSVPDPSQPPPHGGYRQESTYQAAIKAATDGVPFPTPAQIDERANNTRRAELAAMQRRSDEINSAHRGLQQELSKGGQQFNPDRLRHFRKRLNLSQAKAAELAGWGSYGAQRWSNYETGHVTAGLSVAVAAALALQIRPIDLYGPTLEGMQANASPYDQGYKFGYAEGFKAGHNAGRTGAAAPTQEVQP